MAGMLTTHVLDIMNGRPATNMQIQLWRFNHTVGEGQAQNLLPRPSTPPFKGRYLEKDETSDSQIPTSESPAPQWQLLKTVYTTDSGRTSSPLLQGKEFIIGYYELIFAVNTYFSALGIALPEPAFLNDIPIRFAIAHADEHYHVPLLVSPWAYSTYRGS